MPTRKPLPDSAERASEYCAFGAETLVTRSREIENQISGAKKNEDIEYIHKLRVGSRRLRAALSIFEECMPKKQRKAWGKIVKNLTTSCGAARDSDVLTVYLEQYSKGLEPAAALGIEYLIGLQKARRLILQSDVVKVLESLEASGTLNGLSEFCMKLRNRAEKVTIKTLLTYQKAHEHITTRLDELLALSRFVHDQRAIVKHHELRIAAKRLRYTMEIFSPLYKDGLQVQIASVKKFQDVLGEMHDFYVWSQDLKARRREIPPEAKYGLHKLFLHLGKQRASRYRDFVSLWDEQKAGRFFSGIRELTDTGPNSEIIRDLLTDEPKVALISDIHGNLPALEAVVKDARKSGLEIFLNAGDAVGFGIYPSEVIQALQAPMFLSVVGNVDLEVLEQLRIAKGNRNEDFQEPAINELSRKDAQYLRSLPKELRLGIEGKRVLVTHGSPDSVEEHIYPDSPEERLREIASAASADIIVTGHTHLQMNRSVDGVTFVNPGSVGRPVNGEPKAEYAVLTLNPLSVEFRKVNYDIEVLANDMRKRSMPEDCVQVMLRAVPLESIDSEDRILARKQLWKKRSTIEKVRDVAKNYFPDESHSEQDRRLALMIFERTKRLHSLGPRERYWLQCAAILHDIGLSRGGKAHHKASLRLILNDPALPFTQKERYIIGSIARYHRKALPDDNHFNLGYLNHSERGKVFVLAAILRVADALDYAHKSIVTKVNVKLVPGRMVIECFANGRHYLEDRALKRKKDLFEKVFKCNLAVVWSSKAPVTPSSAAKVNAAVAAQATAGSGDQLAANGSEQAKVAEVRSSQTQ
jgi:putative phosphoesterase